MMRSLRLTGCMLALTVSSPTITLAAGYHFILPTVSAEPGAKVRFTIRGDHEQPAQGFSLAASYPAQSLTIERIHIEDTILEALNEQAGVDYFETKLQPGAFGVGVLVDSEPPFDGTLIPAIGQPLDFLHVEFAVAANAAGDLTVQLDNGLFDPPIENLYSINNQGVDVNELSQGVIHLPGGGGGGGSFLRGDFNMDAALDISDPIGILAFAFFGGSSPECVVAGDANDDETIDISDPIFILAYLFAHGPPPPPPFGERGSVDPTPGDLGCGHPSDF